MQFFVENCVQNLPGLMPVQPMEDKSETKGWHCAFAYGFNIKPVIAFKHCPVMHIFAVQKLIKPGWALHIAMLDTRFNSLNKPKDHQHAQSR